ncbi:transposase [Aquibacillus saliphilus]|uniref:transposase n=1 Tax=Aquibacillus saliphilus TaxID=1909422 RepID=UPI001CEFFC0A|nr:transposase [Aquibacillus saliphilus]
MGRKKRIWYPGAKYHITSRGIRRTTLFHNEEDRLEYLRLLEETMMLMPFFLHTYCLMTNHIHLQLETLNHSTGDIIKYLHTKYAKYFNQKISLLWTCV